MSQYFFPISSSLSFHRFAIAHKVMAVCLYALDTHIHILICNINSSPNGMLLSLDCTLLFLTTNKILDQASPILRHFRLQKKTLHSHQKPLTICLYTLILDEMENVKHMQGMTEIGKKWKRRRRRRRVKMATQKEIQP